MCVTAIVSAVTSILLYWATGLFGVWHLFPLVDGAKPTGVSTTADVADFARCVWLWLLVAEFFNKIICTNTSPQNPGHFVLGSFCGGDVLLTYPYVLPYILEMWSGE